MQIVFKHYNGGDNDKKMYVLFNVDILIFKYFLLTGDWICKWWSHENRKMVSHDILKVEVEMEF